MARPLSSADLPPDLARFAEAQVAAGRFESIEDVLRAGKEALEQEQRRHERHEAKLAGTDAALEDGELSGLADDGVFDRVREELDVEPLPHDWNDYLRYRFEQGRAAFARGDYSEESPAVLMARVRARVEKNG